MLYLGLHLKMVQKLQFVWPQDSLPLGACLIRIVPPSYAPTITAVVGGSGGEGFFSGGAKAPQRPPQEDPPSSVSQEKRVRWNTHIFHLQLLSNSVAV